VNASDIEQVGTLSAQKGAANIAYMEEIRAIDKKKEYGKMQSSIKSGLKDESIKKIDEAGSTYRYNFKYYDKDRENRICHFIENATIIQADANNKNASSIVDTVGNVKICRGIKGYYAFTAGSFNMASDYFTDLESLKNSGIINLMQDIYNSNSTNGGEIDVDE